MRIGIVSLGCDKNLVDTEYLAGVLESRGHEVVGQGIVDNVDVLVLCTCGFIESAREESMAALLAYADAKKRLGNPRRLVMAGCLAQRWAQEMQAELPDVDAFAGVGRPETLANLIEEIGKNDSPRPERAATAAAAIPPPSMRIAHPLPRKRLDAAPFGYLKIADGCDHACSFCAIPAMKGPYSSVPREILLDETRALIASGVRELNLIAQDVSPYGRDLYKDYALADLLRDLCRLEGDFRVRVLYFYPSGLTASFLEVFASEPRICRYLDIPLQHFDPEALRAMRRPQSEAAVADRIGELRRAVPDVVLRTTLIVGFPGESPKAFQNLLRGVQRMRFEWLGAFAFSPEEDTPAAAMPNQVDPRAAKRRLDRLMQIQAEITAEIQTQQIGRVLRVLVESVSEDGRQARGRSYREAPEVDGEIIVRLDGDADHAPRVGEFVEVRITDADMYDLIGEPASPDR